MEVITNSVLIVVAQIIEIGISIVGDFILRFIFKHINRKYGLIIGEITCQDLSKHQGSGS